MILPQAHLRKPCYEGYAPVRLYARGTLDSVSLDSLGVQNEDKATKTLEIDKTFCKQFSEKGHFDKIWP